MSAVSLLLFAGSTRPGSINTKLAAAVAAMAAGIGFAARHISLADYPAPLYDPQLDAAEGPPESIVALYGLIANSDAVFLASPEYNGGYTPLMKNTIDWLSRVKADGRHAFRDPVYSLGATSPGLQAGINGLFQLRPTIARLGAIVMPEQLTVPNGPSAFKEDGSFENERTVSLAKAQLERLHHVAGRLKG